MVSSQPQKIVISLNTALKLTLRLGQNNSKEAREQVTHYVGSARERLAVQSAAMAWAQGVPWAQAIKVCTKAIRKADPKAKALPKGAPRRRAAAR